MTESRTTSDQITEEEFDALLDDLAGQQKSAVSEDRAAKTAKEPNAADNKALISEDEFDALLDEISERKNHNDTAAAVESSPFKLPERLCIADVEAVKASLDSYFAALGDLSFDAGEIERVDSAGLQLLFACKQRADANGRKFSWAATSEELCATAERVGLANVLDLHGSPS